MEEYLAHSERDGIPAQSYLEHTDNVVNKAIKNAEAVRGFSKLDGEIIVPCARASAELHDLGKLMEENQEALRNPEKHAHLPINHVDAGAAALKMLPDEHGVLPALMVYSHHRGLPNVPDERQREKTAYRDQSIGTRTKVNAVLPELLRLHQALTSWDLPTGCAPMPDGDFGVFARMQLSCLADADHTDTAIHDRQYLEDATAPELQAKKRLAALESYVARYEGTDERNRLRAEMYRSCRDAATKANITACDSPVGSGKTTAVMAHLLNQAIAREARRIFVVLPFTNIIEQSVDVYREALTLPGEDPTQVVAELHHRADFESEEARAFSAQWRAPIIVTTAVAFFETIASNRPAALRRLHELPGSVIFVDEAHAALPVKLLPVAWHWIQILADQWSCYWVLASGSLVEFWKIKEIAPQERSVPQIVDDGLRAKLERYENHRIQYKRIEDPLSREALIEAIKAEPGPRLVIMNTVQNAAVIARDLQKSYGKGSNKVLHLSTALTAEDREKTIKAVKERLKDTQDTDWTLVATSCVEAGVNFSFRTGFRELSSLLSLLQAAGRIGRNGEYEDAAIWSFTMQDDPMLIPNKGLADSVKVMKMIHRKQLEISPQLSTFAIQQEINIGSEVSEELLRNEKMKNYADVANDFHVIDSETVLVVPDEELKQQIRYRKCDWREIQRKSVSVYLWRAKKLPKLINEADDLHSLYDWNLGYDSFLGIMAGALDAKQAKNGFLIL